MAQLIVSQLISLDGYCAGPGGNPGVLPMDDAFNAYNLERLRAAGTLVLGRTTFSMFAGFWPIVAVNPDAPAMLREMARLNTAMPKLVVSDTLDLATAPAWGPVEVVSRQGAAARIAEIKQSSGRDLLVFGSHVMWNALLAQGLVNELHLLLGAVVLGDGVRAFEQPAARPLRLLDQRRLEGSETALLRYGA